MKTFLFVLAIINSVRVEAFVPVAAPSSTAVSFSTNSAPQNVRSSFSSSSSSLYMMNTGGGLVDRFGRVVRSTLSNIMASWEDPEKIIVQSVQDMQVSQRRRTKKGLFFID